jgi:hypothetical protein
MVWSLWHILHLSFSYYIDLAFQNPLITEVLAKLRTASLWRTHIIEVGMYEMTVKTKWLYIYTHEILTVTNSDHACICTEKKLLLIKQYKKERKWVVVKMIDYYLLLFCFFFAQWIINRGHLKTMNERSVLLFML